MITRPRPVVVGVLAALAAPYWLSGARWQGLLAPRGGARPQRPTRAAEDAARFALRGVGGLSRLPGGTWRNTCLYRSVAECLALRWMGADACIRIGVGRDAAETTGIVAHAWVLRSAQRDDEADPRARSLRLLAPQP